MKLSSIFTDHMVLQANQTIRIFGEGKGVITVSFLEERKKLVSKEEKWCVELPPKDYGGPYSMTINLDDKEYVFKDIYVGEVWLASGQSNMEMPLFRTEYGLEEAKHSKNDMLRFFTVPRRFEKNTENYWWHFECCESVDTPWQICCEESALHFSALGYYTVKELQMKLGVAVGIISCNWGGMPIETFIKREYFNRHPVLEQRLEEFNRRIESIDYDKYLLDLERAKENLHKHCDSIGYDQIEKVRQMGVRATAGMPDSEPWELPFGIYKPGEPGVLFESMFERIAPFSVKGMLWYQGESNNSFDYLNKYIVFMECIKEEFKCYDMKFYAVELASYCLEETAQDAFVFGNNWAFTREQQQKVTELADNNYLITSMELGDMSDVHPIQKKELAKRVLLKVLKNSYGFEIYADQPTFKEVEFKDGKAYIYLNNADGLYSNDLSKVKMYICDKTHVLKKADIKIENNTIVLSSGEVKNPEIVRYAFNWCYTGGHIYNKSGLPLAPFRTDNDIFSEDNV